jgi:hypothetical protein
MYDVSIVIADLGNAVLGFTDGKTITIDSDAAGHGWFVDSSPAGSEEFRVRLDQNVFAAAKSSEAYGKMDLVTVVVHELGHVLGFDHDDADLYSVMREDLDPGVRYVLGAGFSSLADLEERVDLRNVAASRDNPGSDRGVRTEDSPSGRKALVDWHDRTAAEWGRSLFTPLAFGQKQSTLAEFMERLTVSDESARDRRTNHYK